MYYDDILISWATDGVSMVVLGVQRGSCTDAWERASSFYQCTTHNSCGTTKRLVEQLNRTHTQSYIIIDHNTIPRYHFHAASWFVGSRWEGQPLGPILEPWEKTCVSRGSGGETRGETQLWSNLCLAGVGRGDTRGWARSVKTSFAFDNLKRGT